MLGTENGRYDAPEDAHLFLLLPSAPWRRALVPAHLARRILERFSIPDPRLLSLVTGICKRSAFCDPAITALRSASETASYACPGTVFQPIRFKCHSAPAYGLFFCELVSVSDALSLRLHGLVMQFAHASAQHRSCFMLQRAARAYRRTRQASKAMHPIPRIALLTIV